MKKSTGEMYCEWWAKESVYKYEEIKWLWDILYKHTKSLSRTQDKIKTLLIICANGNIESLYQIRQTLKDGGIIKEKKAMSGVN